jgi:hypothetical protein
MQAGSKKINALLFFLLCLLSVCYFNIVSTTATKNKNTDLKILYTSANFLAADKNPYMHSQNGKAITNLTSPFGTWLFSFPARSFSYATCYVLWIITSFLISLFAIVKFLRYTYGDQLSLTTTLTHLVIFYAFMPSFFNATFGQIAIFLTGWIIALHWALSHKRWFIASFVLAFLFSIKLFFGIFFVFLLFNKRWKTLISSIVISIIFAALPLFHYSLNLYKDYLWILGSVHWYGANWNASFYGILAKIFNTPDHHLKSFFNLPILGKSIFYGLFIIYMALVGLVAKKAKTVKSFDLSFSFTLSTMLLISPLGWSYYFPMLICSYLLLVKYSQTFIYVALLFSVFLLNQPYPLQLDADAPVTQLFALGGLFFVGLLVVNSCALLLSWKSTSDIRPLNLSGKTKALVVAAILLPSLIGTTMTTYIRPNNSPLDSSAHTAENSRLLTQPLKRDKS